MGFSFTDGRNFPLPVCLTSLSVLLILAETAFLAVPTVNFMSFQISWHQVSQVGKIARFWFYEQFSFCKSCVLYRTQPGRAKAGIQNSSFRSRCPQHMLKNISSPCFAVAPWWSSFLWREESPSIAVSNTNYLVLLTAILLWEVGDFLT